MITIDDFAKVQLKVGTILSAEELEGSDKLLKLQVDFGPKEQNDDTDNTVILAQAGIQLTDELQDFGQARLAEPSAERAGMTGKETADFVNSRSDENDVRQVLSGIKQWYKPEDLEGKQFIFVTNLAPRKMMGLESQAMIMAAEGEDKPIPLTVSEKVPNGAKIR